MTADRTIEEFANQADFIDWLGRHHADSPGIWLKIAKKGSPASTVDYPQAVEAALRFGWIDGQKKSFDDAYYLQGFTRRSARSPWSRRNREIASRLESAGLLEPGGLAEVERARADGRWDRAYEGQASAQIPEDLLAALEHSPRAKEFFDTLNRQNRYAAVYRLGSAKEPETRARRIEKYIAMFEAGEKFHE